MNRRKILVTGAAGLIGQNLILRLVNQGHTNIVGIDKHPANIALLKKVQPGIQVVDADMSSPKPADTGRWQPCLEACDALVIAHAQIGGNDPAEYSRNNVNATEQLLDAAVRYRVSYVVGISSSVVNSVAIDNYTETKKAQEKLFDSSGLKQIVLRPTLMFGWFDRKHLGWLARFMQRVPVFPVPGSGEYLRQPLFAGDFCNIILSAIEHQMTGTFDITGQERITYIELIRAVKDATGAKARIQKIPYALFSAMLRLNSLFDKNPAFTVKQLEALVTPDIFDVIDWPALFGVRSTPLKEALNQTFCDPDFSKIVLDF